jgi:hypothetical protein
MAILYIGQNDEPLTVKYDYEGGLPAQPPSVLARMVLVGTDETLGWAVIDTKASRAAGVTIYERFENEAGARAKYRFL